MYVLSERWLIPEWWLINAELWLFLTSADHCGQNTGDNTPTSAISYL